MKKSQFIFFAQIYMFSILQITLSGIPFILWKLLEHSLLREMYDLLKGKIII